MTIGEAVSAGAARLVAAGFSLDEAAMDAAVLARAALGWDQARYLACRTEAPPARFADAFTAWIERRARREPVAYITGVREFWGLDFLVSPSVLVPRPESELIIGAALDALAASGAARPRLADIGTGSGCLAVTLARERPVVTVVATDVSAAALAVARANADRHGVADRVLLVRTSILDGVHGPFDVIVSNPPYIAAADRSVLPRDVAEYEPAAALFGTGADGLGEIRGILATAPQRLAPGGVLIMEIGAGQDSAVGAIVGATPGLALVRIRADLQGIPRSVVARRTAG